MVAKGKRCGMGCRASGGGVGACRAARVVERPSHYAMLDIDHATVRNGDGGYMERASMDDDDRQCSLSDFPSNLFLG